MLEKLKNRPFLWYLAIPVMAVRLFRAKYAMHKRVRREQMKTEGMPEGRGETAVCRHRLARYCTGSGLDLGFGGNPITNTALRIDFPLPYTSVGDFPVQFGGNAEDLYWFKDNVLDYVYSSHLLEDYDDTEVVLREWLRVLKPGGRLIIFCPDEHAYRAHCQKTGQSHNDTHKHADFSLAYVKRILDKIGGTEIIHEIPLVDTYSWDLVAVKQDNANSAPKAAAVKAKA